MQKPANYTPYQKRAFLLSILLIIITLGSILWIAAYNNNRSENLLYADIYQKGELLKSIPLSSVAESYSFSVDDGNGNQNVIEVRPGSIGIISATCPDKLCVNQGFIHSSLLPITCLPNGLVIQLRQGGTAENHDDIAPDAITY